jgi:hypothetical protein
MKKNISVSGLTKNQRLKELEKIKTKYQKKGYIFIEYIDNGMTKSIAIFEISEENLKKNKSTLLKKSVIFFMVLAAIIYFSINSNDYNNNTTLNEAKNAPLFSLEKIAKDYVLEKKLDESYNKKFYDCLGEMIWDKDESFTVGKMLDWCYDDYKLSENHKMKQYYNTAWLLSDFSVWDGSYKPLEKLIKSNMHNSDSYENVKTTRNFVYYGTKRPYMQVTTIYKGTNAFNAVVTNTVSIKIDALTKEIFEINQ